MIHILTAAIIALISINVLIGAPKIINLAQTKLVSSSPEVGPIQQESVAGITTQPVPKPLNKSIPPVFSAAGVVAIDVDSGVNLYEKDANLRVPIASTTKIMTALVAAEHFKANDILEVKDLSGVSGSTMGLKVGEKLTFRSVLYGMLLNSGNDAAFTIANNYPGGFKAFIAAMNQRAKDLGLENTHFENPAGFDSSRHFSSASDLSKIAINASQNTQLLRVVGTKETVVASVDKSTVHNLKNLNKLLGVEGMIGFKTGYTPIAKENLVGLVERDGHRVLTVILGSDDRFGETTKLVDWIFENYSWQ